jgi:2-oxoacid:acceptor oxidoreductase delta subunit (pyruvate/2-ketoisovalerate family)
MTERPFAITLEVGSSLGNHTGAWRTERPVYVDKLPPCNDACPAGENVQGWLAMAEEGRYEEAWRQIVEDNPFPAIMGRVCYHPCQTACNRTTLDETVGIHAVERFLGDEALRAGWALPAPAVPTGRRVLVVGAGPAGLSAAYHVRRLGNEVVIMDRSPAPGGMLRYGIPRYRLPRHILDAEIERLLATGIVLRPASAVTDLRATMAEEGFDAAFVAVGASLAANAYIPAGDSAHVLDALSLLAATEAGDPPALGRRVAVYGGGDTAVDAARTARRLGVADPVIVYRRTRGRMPAHEEEVEAAEAEGVHLRWLSTITRAGHGSITVEEMALDDTGFPQPTGRTHRLGADTVILALGERADLSLFDRLDGVRIQDGVVVTGADGSTGFPGVFAGGDAVAGARTVTTAVGWGKAAARAIGAFLGDRGEQLPRHPLATADRLNTWYFADAPASVEPHLAAARRASSFDEVVGGLDETTALYEARRCLSCGNCFECDNCFGVCPDNAVLKLDAPGRYAFDYDFCKGCGICVVECPCGAIEMVPERA